jgi:hypothetical protein
LIGQTGPYRLLDIRVRGLQCSQHRAEGSLLGTLIPGLDRQSSQRGNRANSIGSFARGKQVSELTNLFHWRAITFQRRWRPAMAARYEHSQDHQPLEVLWIHFHGLVFNHEASFPQQGMSVNPFHPVEVQEAIFDPREFCFHDFHSVRQCCFCDGRLVEAVLAHGE